MPCHDVHQRFSKKLGLIGAPARLRKQIRLQERATENEKAISDPFGRAGRGPPLREECLSGVLSISVVIGPQSPAAIKAGGTAVCTVTLTRTDAGSLDAYLTISGLPAGTTPSFSPSPVTFKGSSPSTLTSTLTISTDSSLADGTYPFSVIARVSGSHNICTGSGVLIVGDRGPKLAQAPFILSISLLTENTPQIVVLGTPGALYQLEATASLSSPSWFPITTNTAGTNGLFSFTDLDSANYPLRFYRAANAE